MFKKRSKLVAMLLLLSVLLTGCWDATDVSTLNLCTMTIFDKQQEDTFLFGAEIVKISPAGQSGGGGGGKEYTYLAGSGKSLSEARRAVDMQMDKLLFLGTVRALVITERAAADDLGDICFGCEKIRSIDRR